MKKVVYVSILLCLLTGCTIYESDIELTREKYDRISTGMTYSEVTSILGGSCDKDEETQYEEYTYEYYSCYDKDDMLKEIDLYFFNGKLSSKSQTGLD